jgi:heme O synthase-like polyprenyltransferase
MTPLSKTKSFILILFKLIEPPKVIGICMGVFLGFLLGIHDQMQILDWGLFYLILGNALGASASFILNQLLEVKNDLKMKRTQNRLIASRKVSTKFAYILSSILTTGSLSILLFKVNYSAALFTFLTGFIYVAIYTPLKTKTHLNTTFGALSGALLPLAGFSYHHEITSPLFLSSSAIFYSLAFWGWQMTHAYSLGILYKEDYLIANTQIAAIYPSTLKFTRISTPIFALFTLAPWTGLRSITLTPWLGLELTFITILFVTSLFFAWKPQKNIASLLLKSGLWWVSILPFARWLQLS